MGIIYFSSRHHRTHRQLRLFIQRLGFHLLTGVGGGGWTESPGTGREHRPREAPVQSGESSPLGGGE